LDRTKYIVSRPEETRGFGTGPSSYIPAFGAATTAIDQYRVLGIAESNLDSLSVAITDIASVTALTKIAEGGIADHRDLEAAETALQALLLHDSVHVITAAPKIEYESGMVSYLRQDQGKRSQLGFDLFSLASSRDWIIAPEYIQENQGMIIQSSLKGSILTGKSLAEIRDDDGRFEYRSDTITDSINATIQEHGVPLYLSDENVINTRRGDGFSKRFYHRMRISWNKSVGDMPPLVCSFSLPPLLAIVLDRLNNREDLLSVVAELREQTRSARIELLQLNELITSSQAQAEIEAQLSAIDRSFDAIVPESRLSKAQRMRRRFSVVQKVTHPILKFMAAMAWSMGLSHADILRAANNIESLVFEGREIIDRTVTARTFAGLVNTESIQSLVKHHFSRVEILAIEKSMQRNSR